MSQKQLSLSQLNKQIKESIESAFPETYWVVAEISEFKINRNGHAYLELIEKDNDTDRVTAKARATIWSYTLRMLKPYFETTTNQELKAGLKVLINISLEFHEIYGFSLNIKDIDPAYTLGDIERRRREIIKQLSEEGIFDLNKELELPSVIQKIAVISSATAAGYEDFMKQLNSNPYGYKFYLKLFPAMMQGEQTESSIIAALEHIYEYEDFFDTVVIIRGGGAKADLMSFDKYDLAVNTAQFPLPVITGIGHEKDVSIVDMVSHTSVKTPTAAAEYIISHNADFESYVDSLFEQINEYVSTKLAEEQNRIDYIARNLSPNVLNRLNAENLKLSLFKEQFNSEAVRFIEKQKNILLHHADHVENTVRFIVRFQQKNLVLYHEKLSYRIGNQFKRSKRKLDYFENTVKHLDPVNLLKKGYSITRYNGKILTETNKLKAGNEVETILYHGKFTSKVIKT
jgi:exodeoxyribonuclease VII large subunit